MNLVRMRNQLARHLFPNNCWPGRLIAVHPRTPPFKPYVFASRTVLPHGRT